MVISSWTRTKIVNKNAMKSWNYLNFERQSLNIKQIWGSINFSKAKENLTSTLVEKLPLSIQWTTKKTFVDKFMTKFFSLTFDGKPVVTFLGARIVSEEITRSWTSTCHWPEVVRQVLHRPFGQLKAPFDHCLLKNSR